MSSTTNQHGFTLMELIIVIVLLGILASGAGLLITKPIEAYNDQLRRQQLVDQGEMALRQIARDIRRALPNSLRVDPSGLVIEMINTTGGARYRDEVGGAYTADTDWLDFTVADTDFNLLGKLNVGLNPGDRLVIYNTAPDDIYQDVTANNNPGIVTTDSTTLTLVPGVEDHITLAQEDPIEPDFQFSQQSPGQRIFVINDPISYVCDLIAGTLTRHDGYTYQADQNNIDSDAELSELGSESGLVVSQLASCSFNYNPGSAQRSGMVTIRIVLDDAGEQISLLHQVHVVNVP
ncbi:MAG: type II secretion system GspH family protein [Gammaproteobacteria bacterium]|nr:type II secretion system GspH family protein [Gammaproteobacteria bacterium]